MWPWASDVDNTEARHPNTQQLVTHHLAAEPTPGRLRCDGNFLAAPAAPCHTSGVPVPLPANWAFRRSEPQVHLRQNTDASGKMSSKHGVLGNRNDSRSVQPGVDDEERRALQAEGLNPLVGSEAMQSR
jgi:hypothetical protein